MKLNLNKMFGNKSKEPLFTEEVRTPVRTSYPSSNEKVLSWHLLEDVLGWIAVLVGGVIIYFTNEKVLTLISEGCKFDGNLSSPSTTKIDGHVVGNLRGESGIIIGEKGIVEGNVNAVEVIVYGNVRGNIKAHKLELKKTGSLNGDITVEELVTESGSRFNGSSKMGDDTKSNIIDMKTELKKAESENDIEIHSDEKSKDKPVLKFH